MASERETAYPVPSPHLVTSQFPRRSLFGCVTLDVCHEGQRPCEYSLGRMSQSLDDGLLMPIL